MADLTKQIKELKEWKVNYVKQVDWIFTAFNTYLVSKDESLKEGGIMKWFADENERLKKEESEGIHNPETTVEAENGS